MRHAIEAAIGEPELQTDHSGMRVSELTGEAYGPLSRQHRRQRLCSIQ